MLVNVRNLLVIEIWANIKYLNVSKCAQFVSFRCKKSAQFVSKCAQFVSQKMLNRIVIT